MSGLPRFASAAPYMPDRIPIYQPGNVNKVLPDVFGVPGAQPPSCSIEAFVGCCASRFRRSGAQAGKSAVSGRAVNAALPRRHARNFDAG